MNAILLAAGYATRLYPLTKRIPKALVSIGGRPMLDYQVDELRKLPQIDRIAIISNDRFYRQLSDWAAQRADERIVVLNDGTDSNDNRLGAIGDILYTLERLCWDDDLLVAATDNFLRIDFTKFLDRYEELGKKTLVLAEHSTDLTKLRSYAVAQTEADGCIVHLEEKPQEPRGTTAMLALYAYPREAQRLFFDYRAAGGNMDSPGNLPAWLYTRLPVYAHIADGPCYDIGTFASLEEVRALYGGGTPN